MDVADPIADYSNASPMLRRRGPPAASHRATRRRKWATERKHIALVDVAEAGGWLSTVTLATCYQQPTNEMVLAVMNEDRKVRDVAVIDRA